MLINSDWSA